jgi:hypothetical protein
MSHTNAYLDAQRHRPSQIYGAESFMRSKQSFSYLNIVLHFMEPKRLLHFSLKPNIGPYPEPDESNPYEPIPFL